MNKSAKGKVKKRLKHLLEPQKGLTITSFNNERWDINKEYSVSIHDKSVSDCEIILNPDIFSIQTDQKIELRISNLDLGIIFQIKKGNISAYKGSKSAISISSYIYELIKHKYEIVANKIFCTVSFPFEEQYYLNEVHINLLSKISRKEMLKISETLKNNIIYENTELKFPGNDYVYGYIACNGLISEKQKVCISGIVNYSTNFIFNSVNGNIYFPIEISVSTFNFCFGFKTKLELIVEFLKKTIIKLKECSPNHNLKIILFSRLFMDLKTKNSLIIQNPSVDKNIYKCNTCIIPFFNYFIDIYCLILEEKVHNINLKYVLFNFPKAVKKYLKQLKVNNVPKDLYNTEEESVLNATKTEEVVNSEYDSSDIDNNEYVYKKTLNKLIKNTSLIIASSQIKNNSSNDLNEQKINSDEKEQTKEQKIKDTSCKDSEKKTQFTFHFNNNLNKLLKKNITHNINSNAFEKFNIIKTLSCSIEDNLILSSSLYGNWLEVVSVILNEIKNSGFCLCKEIGNSIVLISSGDNFPYYNEELSEFNKELLNELGTNLLLVFLASKQKVLVQFESNFLNGKRKISYSSKKEPVKNSFSFVLEKDKENYNKKNNSNNNNINSSVLNKDLSDEYNYFNAKRKVSSIDKYERNERIIDSTNLINGNSNSNFNDEMRNTKRIFVNDNIYKYELSIENKAPPLYFKIFFIEDLNNPPSMKSYNSVINNQVKFHENFQKIRQRTNSVFSSEYPVFKFNKFNEEIIDFSLINSTIISGEQYVNNLNQKQLISTCEVSRNDDNDFTFNNNLYYNNYNNTINTNTNTNINTSLADNDRFRNRLSLNNRVSIALDSNNNLANNNIHYPEENNIYKNLTCFGLDREFLNETNELEDNFTIEDLVMLELNYNNEEVTSNKSRNPSFTKTFNKKNSNNNLNNNFDSNNNRTFSLSNEEEKEINHPSSNSVNKNVSVLKFIIFLNPNYYSYFLNNRKA